MSITNGDVDLKDLTKIKTILMRNGDIDLKDQTENHIEGIPSHLIKVIFLSKK